MLHQTHTSALRSENEGSPAARSERLGRGALAFESLARYCSTPPCIGHHGPFSSSVRMTGPSAVTATVFS